MMICNDGKNVKEINHITSRPNAGVISADGHRRIAMLHKSYM